MRSGDVHPSWRYEEKAAGHGASRIAGVDEAGRGPLAGPVVAAAVVLSHRDPLPGLKDSKLLSASRREELFPRIMELATAVGIGIADVETIDRINILEATKQAMTMAIQQIRPLPDHLLVDGPIGLSVPIPQYSIIGGDRISCSVAAAAIVAKVSRDRIMLELHTLYPQYGFDKHKGYGTKDHRDAIVRYGPCPVHRKCFKGVKEHIPGPIFAPGR